MEALVVQLLNTFVFPDDPIAFDELQTFGENFASNVLTRGLNNFYARNAVDTLVATGFDVSRGNDMRLSLAINAAASFGSETLFNAVAARVAWTASKLFDSVDFRTGGKVTRHLNVDGHRYVVSADVAPDGNVLRLRDAILWPSGTPGQAIGIEPGPGLGDVGVQGLIRELKELARKQGFNQLIISGVLRKYDPPRAFEWKIQL